MRKKTRRKTKHGLTTLKQRFKANSLAQLNRLNELDKLDKLGSEDTKFLKLRREYDELEREFDRRLAKRRVPVVIYGAGGRTITTLDKL